MSEQDGEEKTEDPSSRKLKKAREKGEIARSQMLISIFSTIGAGLATLIYFSTYFEYIFKAYRGILANESLSLEKIVMVLKDAIVDLSIPSLVGAGIGALFGSILANKGFIFSFEKIKPKSTHLSPKSYVKRTFSRAGLVSLIQVTIIMVLVFILYGVVLYYFKSDFFKIIFCGTPCGIQFLPLIIQIYLGSALMIVLITALLDIKLQEVIFLHQQRSTKTEVKREQKEDMGEPVVRQERTRQHEVMLTADTVEQILEDTSLILHFDEEVAVAIRYFKEGNKEHFFIVDGAFSHGAQRLIAGARAYNANDPKNVKPLVRAQEELSSTLSRYEAMQEITDDATVAELRRIIRKLQ